MFSNLSPFTKLHVVLSLIGIVSGLVVMFGLLVGRRLNAWTALFLITTVLTSVTGFFFPFHGVTPAIVVGIISLVLLAVAILARYARHLAGHWRWIYVVCAMIAGIPRSNERDEADSSTRRRDSLEPASRHSRSAKIYRKLCY